MKKFLTTLFSILLIFAVSLFLSSSVLAKVIANEKGTVTVAKDEVINDDLFVGSESVEIYGTVNGNVYAGGQTVRVDGTINGDLHTGASVVYISGTIKDSVYAGAGNITVSGAKIGNSLHVGAGNLNIDKDTTIGGSLIAGAGTITIYGPVLRNVMVGGGSVDINSKIGGEVRIGAGDITIGPDATITKDVYYMIDNDQSDIKISSSASVSGTVKRIQNNLGNRDIEAARKDVAKTFRRFDIFTKITSFLGALLIGFLWLRLFPKSLAKPSEIVANSLFKSLGIGLLAILLIAPVLLIMAITMIGLPLAGITVLLFLLSMYLSKLVAGFALGNWISGKAGWKKLSTYLAFALGLTVIYLLKLIPAVGFVTSFLAFCGGLGALIIYYRSLVSQK